MKKKVKGSLAITLAMLMCIGSITGCGKSAGESGTAETTKESVSEAKTESVTEAKTESVSEGGVEAPEDLKATIGITFQDLSNEFVSNKKKALMDYVSKNYPNIEVLYLDGAGDASTQVSQMETFINQGVDAIICNPQESTTLQPSYEKAIAAGIPVVSDGTDIDEKIGQVWSSCPDVPGAEEQVKYLMTLFPEDQTIDVAIMRGVIGHQAEIFRSEGYDNVMNENPDKFNIVFDQTANYSREEGLQLMENWLSSGTHIDAVLAQNDEMALGAVEAIKSAGKEDEIKVLGIDGIEDAVSGVKNGSLAATMFQDGTQIIINSFELAVKSIRGEEVSDIALSQELCTPENVDTYVEKLSYLAGLSGN